MLQAVTPGSLPRNGLDKAQKECQQILRDAERTPDIHGDEVVYKTFKVKYITEQRSALVAKLTAELSKVQCELAPAQGGEAERKERLAENWKQLIDGVYTMLDSALEVHTAIIRKET